MLLTCKGNLSRFFMLSDSATILRKGKDPRWSALAGIGRYSTDGNLLILCTSGGASIAGVRLSDAILYCGYAFRDLRALVFWVGAEGSVFLCSGYAVVPVRWRRISESTIMEMVIAKHVGATWAFLSLSAWSYLHVPRTNAASCANSFCVMSGHLGVRWKVS